MNQLTQLKCIACRKGEPTVTDEEIAEFRPQVPDWDISEVDGVKRLEKVFKFDNFVHALAFTNKIGELAEEEGHHPALLTEWGKVTVSWWTHKIRGLHRNDFIMAAKIDGSQDLHGELDGAAQAMLRVERIWTDFIRYGRE